MSAHLCQFEWSQWIINKIHAIPYLHVSSPASEFAFLSQLIHRPKINASYTHICDECILSVCVRVCWKWWESRWMKCCSIYVSCFIVLLIMATFSDSIVLCYGFQAVVRCCRFINSFFITSLYIWASLSGCLSPIYMGKLPLPVDQSTCFKWVENLYRDTQVLFHFASTSTGDGATCIFTCAQERYWETRVTCHSNSTCHFSPNIIWHFLFNSTCHFSPNSICHFPFNSTCHLVWSKIMM